jgi:alpha-tubulin suppressor-like RCC1 family protein
MGGVGDGTWKQRLTPASVAGGLLFSQVSTGAWHSCGKTLEGVAFCWGGNGTGQLGDGTTNTRTKPVAVAGPI